MDRPAGVRLSSSPADPRPETARERTERRYAEAERGLDGYYAKRRRRGPPTLLATLIVLTLAVAVVVAVDMHRLQTPRGAAQNWVGATVFGNCEAFEKRSVAGPDIADPRTPQQRCDALVAASEPNRRANASVTIDVTRVVQKGDAATADVRVRFPGGPVATTLMLRRDSPGWIVVRTAETCRVLRCG